MDYEKKYKEALERAKAFELPEYKNIAESIFPELKNDDEKIRKALLEMVHDTTGDELWVDYNVHKEDALAWLEKQGTIIDINPSEFEMRLNKLLKQFESLPKEDIVSSLSFYLNVIQNDGTYKAEEKQGEQKPAEVRSIGYWHVEDDEQKPIYDTRYEVGADGSISVNGKPFDYEKATITQKDFAQKEEPKFKVGEWILYSGDHYEGVRHITKIDENGYYIERNGLPHGIIPFDHEICMRLWTIQDAKNGDVLVDEDNNIGIYKEIEGLCWHSYIYLGCDNHLRGFSIGGSHIKNNTKPATKEQCDILLKAMADAGYEWDAEKKELKKLTQSVTKKSDKVWSEEDEAYKEFAISAVEDYYDEENPLQKELVGWLKSIKDRLSWKPNKKQMETLEYYMHTLLATEHKEVLFGLYNDLKKL